jgi:hypothetical protein
MSTEPHKYWPSVGSVWEHWSDLFLAIQLAALRAGFTGLTRVWDPQQPNLIKFRCNVKLSRNRTGQCSQRLVVAKPVNDNRPDEAWEVMELKAGNLESERHPSHSGAIGLSSWLKVRTIFSFLFLYCFFCFASLTLFLPAGRTFGTSRAGCREHHRRLPSDAHARRCRTLRCEAEGPLRRRCPFLVKLRLLDRKEGEEQRFRCIEIHQRHTCLTEAKVPNKHLESRIKFFVRSSLPLILSDESD